jgi:GH18 family chitinase
MKLICTIVFFLFTSFFSSTQGQTTHRSPEFKIVGYYPLQAAVKADLTTVPFSKLTYINLWFINADSLGNFSQDLSGLAAFMDAAHASQVKVLFSIGGGSRQAQYHHLLKKEKRSLLINNLVSLAVQHKADGIDVDLEGSDIDENYEEFIVELAAALRSHHKLITAAIAVYYKDQLSDKALAQYDFVNVMSYDRTGPWRPEKPGPHATYAHAVEDLEYFGTVRAIPKEKMTLGVPFYGYGYGPTLSSPAISMNYGEIISRFPGSHSVDQWQMPDGKILYYNGVETIRQKTALAKEKASGIMVWQVMGDAAGANSLLEAIHKTAYEKK